jgi:hypothetical protein
VRTVGAEPEELTYALVPEKIMPGSLEEALNWTEQGNPELMALNAALIEAGERVALARSAYMPKVNIELSSRYSDQFEGEKSWKHTNDAMLMLRWNLFNGGQDIAGVNAALSREYQSRSNRDDKLIELREATSSAWAIYFSLQREKKAYRQATNLGKWPTTFCTAADSTFAKPGEPASLSSRDCWKAYIRQIKPGNGLKMSKRSWIQPLFCRKANNSRFMPVHFTSPTGPFAWRKCWTGNR